MGHRGKRFLSHNGRHRSRTHAGLDGRRLGRASPSGPKKDYPFMGSRDFRILLVEMGPSVLPGFPESLGLAARRILEKKAVGVRLRSAVEGYYGLALRLQGGETIPCRTLIWAAAMRGHELLQGLRAETSPQGRLLVGPTLQIPGHPQAYVIGDAAYLEIQGRPLPVMAPVAIQMARQAARTLLRQMKEEKPLPFRYRDPGLLATIGKNAAVAKVGGIHLKGFPAWLVWLLVHLLASVGFRSRLMVLINWAWDYLFYERADRIIVNFRHAP